MSWLHQWEGLTLWGSEEQAASQRASPVQPGPPPLRPAPEALFRPIPGAALRAVLGAGAGPPPFPSLPFGAILLP